MATHYTDDVRFKVDKEQRQVSISVRLNDNTVIVKTMSISEFKVKIDQAREDLENA